ncbi:unnamed protein product [Microthlaspi erraticum]|uniref:Pre-mRNA-splicing factor SYF1 central HAT repeats domain-containing protein n=1 Tax=Microthlaspi erraticum TaxID=1685480 RepID=A0A6D2IMI5_9BRAS|nr:unnamed protein product [Microthlaspi erraticum]
MQRKILGGHWLNDGNDVDLRLARLEDLMNRRPELVNSVMLRQNPHNVEQWLRRVKLFEGDAEKQIHTYTEAVKTVDPMKATGKVSPHAVEMELRHNNFTGALMLMRRATAEPSLEVRRMVASEAEPVQSCTSP